ncbi:phosphate ABC transporter permease PstA [Cellulomonas sp. McL0617]|uniref:phosphate ABC transporter permease PstA n=1 Tax=Cellulomonas sp. McL0617 TaxID=3415675 RepID=UPI003CEC50F3
MFDLIGAAAAALATALLLFGKLTAMHGGIGLVVVALAGFVGYYALLVSLHSTAQEVIDKVVTVLLRMAGATLFSVLVFIVVYTLVRGFSALHHLNFFTQTMWVAGPQSPLTDGGILHAIVGTLIQISIALAITVPLGIMTAVFLNEVGGRFAKFVRTISDAMTALPSVVAGLFILAAVVQPVFHERNGFAAALAISVMMLPIIIRSADVVLRLVPHNLREASYALGTSRWRTVWHVVLPTAKSGLATAVILGTARGLGETSPVLLTSGVAAVMTVNPLNGPMLSLPLAVYNFVTSPQPNQVVRGFGAAATLLIVVLILFGIARRIGGRGPGHTTPRQQRGVHSASVAAANRLAAYRRTPAAPTTAPPEPAEEQLP